MSWKLTFSPFTGHLEWMKVVTTTVPTTPSYALLESGSYVLLENGSKLILEG
jgi:hypothetical protein